GDTGNDVLIGGEGNDDLEDWDTQSNYINAGAGDDLVYVQNGRNFVIGGAGVDEIDVFGADSVLAFNRGDGQDLAYAGERFTLSLGGGIAAADLSLEADGVDLILRTGGNDAVRLSRQFEPDPSAWPEFRLQIIGDDVRVYDLRAVVDYFYQQAQAQPG